MRFRRGSITPPGPIGVGPGSLEPRQLFGLLLALVVLPVLAPGAATATGQLMSIVDTNDADIAAVDLGRLRVGDGDGNLTVNGAVAPAVAGGQLTKVVTVYRENPAGVFTFSGATKFALTSLTLSHRAIGLDPGTECTPGQCLSTNVDVKQASWESGGSCSSFRTKTLKVRVRSAPGTTHLPFPQPLAFVRPTSTTVGWCMVLEQSYRSGELGSIDATIIGNLY